MKYRYVTQKHIDSGVFNVKSAEEFSDVQTYNANMINFRKQRYRFLAEYWWVVGTNALIVPLILYCKPEINPLFQVNISDYKWLLYTLCASFAFLFIFFVMHKKDYDWKKCLVYTSLLVPIDTVYIILVIMNCLLMYLFGKLDRQLRDEPGYPHFVQLKVTVIKEEDEKEAEEKYSFDKYKSDVLDMEDL